MLLRFKHTKKINKNVNQFHFENLQIVIDFFYFSWMLFKCWKNVIMLTSNYLLFIFYMFSFLPAQVNRIVFVLSWWKLTIVCTLIYQSEIRKMEQTPSLLNVSITQFFLFIFMELQHSYNVAFHANKFNEKNCVQYKLNVKTKKKTNNSTNDFNSVLLSLLFYLFYFPQNTTPSSNDNNESRAPTKMVNTSCIHNLFRFFVFYLRCQYQKINELWNSYHANSCNNRQTKLYVSPFLLLHRV